MSKGRHTEAEMIGALKQMEAGRKAEGDDLGNFWRDIFRRLGGRTRLNGFAWFDELDLFHWHIVSLGIKMNSGGPTVVQ